MTDDQKLAVKYASEAGFDGTNHEVIYGMLFDLMRVLVNAGYTFGTAADMMRDAADCHDAMHKATNYRGMKITYPPSPAETVDGDAK